MASAEIVIRLAGKDRKALQALADAASPCGHEDEIRQLEKALENSEASERAARVNAEAHRRQADGMSTQLRQAGQALENLRHGVERIAHSWDSTMPSLSEELRDLL